MANQHPALSILPRWSRPVVSATGDTVDLLIRITAPGIDEDHACRPPVDLAFVLDRSGSMTGEKLQTAKHAVNIALDLLQDQDRAALIAFDDQINLLHPLLPATSTHRIALRAALHRLEAGGSTDLAGGWLTACEQLATAPSGADESWRIRRVIVLTDGEANMGMTDPDELLRHASDARMRGITTTTFGFGTGFDEFLLAGLAAAGGGDFEFLVSADQLVAVITRELGEMFATTARNLRLTMTLPSGLCGTVSGQSDGKLFPVVVGDIAGGETVDLLFRLTASAGEPGDELPVRLSASWQTPAQTVAEWTEELPSLLRVSAAEAAAIPDDPQVQERAALSDVADVCRQAMRRDRNGDYAGSRSLPRLAFERLHAAPPTDLIRSELDAMTAVLHEPDDQPLPEPMRKQVIARAHRIGRGRKSGSAKP